MIIPSHVVDCKIVRLVVGVSFRRNKTRENPGKSINFCDGFIQSRVLPPAAGANVSTAEGTYHRQRSSRPMMAGPNESTGKGKGKSRSRGVGGVGISTNSPANTRSQSAHDTPPTTRQVMPRQRADSEEGVGTAAGGGALVGEVYRRLSDPVSLPRLMPTCTCAVLVAFLAVCRVFMLPVSIHYSDSCGEFVLLPVLYCTVVCAYCQCLHVCDAAVSVGWIQLHGNVAILTVRCSRQHTHTVRCIAQ